MSGSVYALAQGAQAKDLTVAAAKVSANLMVKAQTGPIGLMTDVITFPGPTVTGNWVVAATRVTIRGIPVVTTTSQGVCFNAVGAPTSPMTVVLPDTRVQAQ